MSSSFSTPAVNTSEVCSAFSAGASSSRFVILKPATMVSMSASSPRKLGSIAGGAIGSALLQPDAAAALRAQQADVTREAGPPAPLAATIAHHRHAQIQLDIVHIH